MVSVTSPKLFGIITQADTNVVRRLDLSSYLVSTLAGAGGTLIGSADGVGTSAGFAVVFGLAIDAAGTFALIVSPPS